jgi:hypothetical protein
MRFAWVGAGVFAGACALPRPALAQSAGSSWHFLADGSVGGFGRPGSTVADLGSGMDLGMAGLLSWRFLEIGASARFGGWVLPFPASRIAVAGLAGIGTHGAGFGGDLLAEGGLHDYSAIGGCGFCLFESDPGASGTTPYLGVRAGLTYRLPARQPGGGRPVPLVGAWLFVSRDTSTEWVTYSASELFAPNIQETQRIGGSLEIGVSLRVAGDWELGAAHVD